MSAVLTQPRRPGSPATSGLMDAVLLGLALLAMVGLTTPALRGARHVDQVTVDNPGAWAVSVALLDADGRPRLYLGPVGAASERTFDQVLDQGDEWVFRFSYAGVEAEAHRAGRQLEADQWRVTVPAEMAERLRAAGAPESAR